MQISTIKYQDTAYPDQLRNIHKKSPEQLFVFGTLPKDNMIAIVGTRKCTKYGEKMTYDIAFGLAQAGAVIVSGLARGIDGIAHRAALDAGGKTVAVLGHGLDHIYPDENRDLAEEIVAKGGAVVTEYELNTPTLPFMFADRNRIIAGLSDAVIVTESPEEGGSLLTARDAMQSNRRVMAVPGHVTVRTSAGTNHLIRSGATFITSAADAIVDLGYHAREPKAVPARSKEEAQLLKLIGKTQASSEQLITDSGLSAAQFANIITLMEITGKVRNLGAGQWVIR
jgi:DNA processing protein